ncbi:MAG TPA: sigma-70 family RNA polymerase sigma factor, partial [Roseiflexaceae bacterium]|nr:sigma-70 family RNA polymerase sigma factor [Roseiflexaceae bacterium]
RPRRQPAAARPADVAPELLDIEALRRRCLVESERFYRGQPHDTRYAYELFRRAIVERCEVAWEHLYALYRPLVESWVRRSGAFASSGETSEYFVAPAFTRFWQALAPERFAAFPTLASLLHYLQLCAASVVIDSVRVQSWAEMLPEEAIPYGHAGHTAPDEAALDRISRQEFWRFIDAQLSGEAERAVVYDSFVLGMKPGDIFGRHRHLFADVADVYNIKRNVLGRLSRNQELRRMMGL